MKTIISEETAYTAENGTSIINRVIPLFEFHELSEDAQNRVISEYASERENDPYFPQWFYDCYEHDVWECVHDLEKSISGARVNWRYNRWYSADFDCEYSYNDCYDPCELETVDDNGICYSMDLCDTWNAHIRELNAINARFELIEQYMEETASNYDYWNLYTAADRVYNRLDDMRSDLIGRWYNELEKACDDVRNTIETLLRGEWEYYTSEECARDDFEGNHAGEEYRTRDNSGRVYYSDSRKWYTASGELFEESNITHECVSIVKAS